jgi:hypothetical protein
METKRASLLRRYTTPTEVVFYFYQMPMLSNQIRMLIVHYGAINQNNYRWVIPHENLEIMQSHKISENR